MSTESIQVWFVVHRGVAEDSVYYLWSLFLWGLVSAINGHPTSATLCNLKIWSALMYYVLCILVFFKECSHNLAYFKFICGRRDNSIFSCRQIGGYCFPAHMFNHKNDINTFKVFYAYYATLVWKMRHFPASNNRISYILQTYIHVQGSCQTTRAQANKAFCTK